MTQELHPDDGQANSVHSHARRAATYVGPAIAERIDMASSHDIERILVATDFSAHAQAAADLAVSIARAKNAELAVFHALRCHEHSSIPPKLADELRKDSMRQCDRHLRELAGGLSDALGRRVSSRVRNAEPARGLIEFAAEWEPDLIAMGTHGADSGQRAWLGSVVARVARKASCPILVTHEDRAARSPKDGVFGHVLVAIDYSVFSRPAAELAVSLAEPGSLIEMIHIFTAPQQALGEARAEELLRLEKLAGQIDLAPVQVSLTAELGRVADQLIDYATNSKTDVIIIGAHGRDASASYLGSVADRVLRSSPVPVILLPDAG